jgi:hypothetical protein
LAQGWGRLTLPYLLWLLPKWWAIFCGDFVKLLDDIKGAYFAPLNFDEGRDAFLIKHVANEADEVAIIHLDGGWPEYDSNVLLS